MNIALILSGGTGERAGTNIPKQYIEIFGKTIISYSIEQLSAHSGIDKIHIVADTVWHTKLEEWIDATDMERKFSGFSAPGKTRQLSILNGLEDIRKYACDSDYVLIHDAARPMLSSRLIADCLNAMEGHEGVLPVLRMQDTVYGSKDGKTVTKLLDRAEIYAGQTPELFCLGLYYKANCRLLPDEILRVNGSTEPAILAGMDITLIPGDEDNFKITTKADMERFQSMMKLRHMT